MVNLRGSWTLWLVLPAMYCNDLLSLLLVFILHFTLFPCLSVNLSHSHSSCISPTFFIYLFFFPNYLRLLFSQTFTFRILTIPLCVWIWVSFMKCSEIWTSKTHFSEPERIVSGAELQRRNGEWGQERKMFFFHNLFTMSCWQGHVITCGCQQVSRTSRVSWRLAILSSVHLTVTA